VKKVIIPGAAGFAGSNFCRHFVRQQPQATVVAIDKMTYAGRVENVMDLLTTRRIDLVVGDVCDLQLLGRHFEGADCVIHFAAESHVDNAIGDSLTFTRTNTLGTHTLLEAARAKQVPRVIHVSTDEVYGEVVQGAASEEAPMQPTNPYSASKAAAELVARAYRLTYQTPLVVTRANNLFGPYQYPEKIIPRFLVRALSGRELPLHGDGSHRRSYLYIDDFCRAMYTVVMQGVVGATYNIGADDELSNMQIARKVCALVGCPLERIVHVADRPFNDSRYRVDDSRLRGFGWKPEVDFDEALMRTCAWYDEQRSWWASLEW